MSAGRCYPERTLRRTTVQHAVLDGQTEPQILGVRMTAESPAPIVEGEPAADETAIGVAALQGFSETDAVG